MPAVFPVGAKSSSTNVQSERRCSVPAFSLWFCEQEWSQFKDVYTDTLYYTFYQAHIFGYVKHTEKITYHKLTYYVV